MTVNFEELLKKPAGEAKRPDPIPAGTGFGMVKAFKFAEARFVNEATGEKNVVCVLTIVPTRMGEEVDAETIAKMQPPLAGRQVQAELPITGGSEWITTELLKAFGIDVSRGWRECIPELVNNEVMFDVTQRADKNNPEIMYNDIRKVRKVPA